MKTITTAQILAQNTQDQRVWILGHLGYLENDEVSSTKKNIPKEIKSLRNINIKQISSGGYHCLFLTQSGDVLSMGWNKLGQLGLGHYDEVEELKPQKIKTKNLKVIQIEASGRHSLLLTNDGKVFSFGLINPEKIENSPTLIKKLSNYRVNYISTGFWHNVFGTACGKVFVSGKGDEGKLGLGNQNDYFDPVEITSLKNIQIKQCTGGAWHTVLLTAQGKVFVWGSNYWGQLGLDKENETKDRLQPVELEYFQDKNVVKVACGSNFTLCLTEDGKVFSFGCSSNFKTGQNNENTIYTPIKITQFPIDDKIIDIHVGSNHSVFLTETKKVLTCGWNKYGQLGHQNIENIAIVESLKNIEISKIGAGAFYSIVASNTEIKRKSGWIKNNESFSDICIFTEE
eukprot:gene8608-555_t